MVSNKLPLVPHHLGVSSGVSKMRAYGTFFANPTPYCTDSNTISKWTGMRFHMTHSPRSSIGCVQDDFWADGTFNTNRAPILHQDYHYLQMDSNKIPLEPQNLGVSSGVFKTISEPMVHLAQTAHLSCVKISTISKRTQTSFHLSLVT
jgi:hypothetical protein